MKYPTDCPACGAQINVRIDPDVLAAVIADDEEFDQDWRSPKFSDEPRYKPSWLSQ